MAGYMDLTAANLDWLISRFPHKITPLGAIEDFAIDWFEYPERLEIKEVRIVNA